jgi:hypothetical protein
MLVRLLSNAKYCWWVKVWIQQRTAIRWAACEVEVLAKAVFYCVVGPNIGRESDATHSNQSRAIPNFDTFSFESNTYSGWSKRSRNTK